MTTLQDSRSNASQALAGRREPLAVRPRVRPVQSTPTVNASSPLTIRFLKWREQYCLFSKDRYAVCKFYSL